MVIEVGGVWLLAEILGLQDMFAKFCTQFIVLALNYIFSKFIIFTTGKRIGGSKWTVLQSHCILWENWRIC